MMDLKKKWKAAKAEVDRISEVRAELVSHTDDEYDAAQIRLEQIEEDAEGELIARCEGCTDLIFEGDPYHCSSDCDIYTCKECSPTYQDILNSPQYFEGADGEPMTTKQAADFVNAHTSTGGSVSDSLAT